MTLLLGSAILTQIKSPGALPVDPFFFLIGLTYALTAVYSMLLRQTEQHRWIVDVQLACDAFVISALIHLTGGITSLFSPLYILPIIAAATAQSQRAALRVGGLSSFLYGLIVYLPVSLARRPCWSSSARKRCRRRASRSTPSASTSLDSFPSRR